MTVMAAAVLVPHLLWAQQLVADLSQANNSYGRSPLVVQWKGVDGASISRNHSDCSSLITALWRRAYGLDAVELRRWLGRANPQAKHYHAAITQANRFQRILQVSAIQPGDLLASLYQQPRPGATGHLMLAAGRPTPAGACWSGRCAYRLVVIDSSRSGHGPMDTRGGGSGVGRGVIQLLTTVDGQLLGFRWSESQTSRWRLAPKESLVVGRFSW
jgi:hypothetical protein